jgi:hypothetical protein
MVPGPTLKRSLFDASENTLPNIITKIDPNLDPATFNDLTTGAVYGPTGIQDISGMTRFILADAATWINTVKDNRERNIIRLLLKKLGYSISYPRPEWAATIGKRGDVCDSFKEMMDKAVKLSNEKLARFSSEYDAYNDSKEAILNETDESEKQELQKVHDRTYGPRELLIHNEGIHPMYVPNPYVASQYREALTSFADPVGLPDSELDPSGTMFAMNYKIANELIPKELIADKQITTAILESLWYCGNNPDLRNDPRCFASRFLGEFRTLGELKQQESAATAVAQAWEWPTLKRVLRGIKSAIPGHLIIDPRLPTAPGSPASAPAPAPAPTPTPTSGSPTTTLIPPRPLRTHRIFRPLIPLPLTSTVRVR